MVAITEITSVLIKYKFVILGVPVQKRKGCLWKYYWK
jgi:hypothetical protein